MQESFLICIIKVAVNKQLFVYLGILSFLILSTLLIILYGKGYRFRLDQGRVELSGTGLLVATSSPDGAGIYINEHLTTATNNTINLAPQEYDVKIAKAGYFPWEKKIKIQKEVVSKADALLFPKAPKLESITDSGVGNPVIDPSFTKIAFTVSGNSSRKNGIYILDMTTRPILTLQSSSTQIADDTFDIFSEAELAWSPDARELTASVASDLTKSKTTYLLKIGFNQNPKDVTEVLGGVHAAWDKDRQDREKARIDGLKPKLKKNILENFQILDWALDESKILYQASSSGTLPLILDPPLIGTNSMPEERSLTKGTIYVYDIKEDKNYKIDAPPPLSWFPDSKHLFLVNNNQIQIMEYDGTNKTTVYAGPFINDYVFPWPDGSKMVILTNLGNTNIPPNLYTISLK